MASKVLEFTSGDTFVVTGVVTVEDETGAMVEPDISTWGMECEIRDGNKLLGPATITKNPDVSPGSYTLRAATVGWEANRLLRWNVRYTTPDQTRVSTPDTNFMLVKRATQ